MEKSSLNNVDFSTQNNPDGCETPNGGTFGINNMQGVLNSFSTGSRTNHLHDEIIDFENRKDSNTIGGGGNGGGSKKPMQDSEDSSYDSDCEVSDGTAHYDVSRTVSDTLGQEFAEYVTLSSSSETTQALTSPGRNAFELDPGYASKVEFAKKLGYTETLVQLVLNKLGPSPSQNELLNELIQLDSSNVSISTEMEDESFKAAAAAAPPRYEVASLRHIIVDGSNVAMSHGNNKVFSCRGIKLTVDYFRSRGHKKITVFLPSYRKEKPQPDDPISDKDILESLEKERVLVYTPSRTVNNRRLVCYDDRFILKLAVDTEGIVVSNDNYRDLTLESSEFKRVVEERLLMYSFVNDRFMPPEDPLGRNGPKLDQFLSHAPVHTAPPCPYGRKCTYGQKCKYYHSTQQKSVSETLRKQAAMKTQSVPISKTSQASISGPNLMPISRTKSAVVSMESGKFDGSQLSGANPHKKLQRQLSINPGGDPRISQAWNNNRSGISSGASVSADPFTSHRNTTYLHPFPGNPALSEVWSPPGLTTPTTRQHQNSSPTNSSPELLSIPPSGCFGGSSGQQQSTRTRMYYHLSAIFPEEQVRHVMGLYPDETDPTVICRAIINLFK